jgi:hypothetical protein
MTHPETNNHHLFFPKRHYKKYKSFRNQEGLVLRDVDVKIHNYLHRQIDPPPKPEREEMAELRTLLEEARYYPHASKFWGAEIAMSYFVAVELEHPEYADRAKQTRTNIAKQIGTFVHGEVPPTEELRLFDGYTA